MGRLNDQSIQFHSDGRERDGQLEHTQLITEAPRAMSLHFAPLIFCDNQDQLLPL